MAQPYSNLEEMISLSHGILRKLSLTDLAKIKRWFILSKTESDFYTVFSYRNQIYDCLWNIPEAVDMGFNRFITEELQKYKELLEYHDKNCEHSCVICQDREELFEMLGDTDERTKPQLC